MNKTRKPERRRWLQFTLRTLLIAVLVLSLPLSWFAVKLERVRKRREAVGAIQKLAGRTWYAHQFVEWGVPIRTAAPPGPAWLRKLLGDDFFTDVVAVTLTGPEVTDDRLKALDNLTELRWASLAYTNISDAGLGHLRGCTQLQGLILSHTRVTDKGMDYLGGLNGLRDVALNGTQVTDEGMQKLQQVLPRCSVNGFFVD